MSERHTQGEMVFEDKRPSCNGFSLFVGDQYVAFIGDSDSVTDAMANSERMAACWNACQGIDTADLNAGSTESKVNTTTATPTPEALAIAVIFRDFAIDHTPDGWPAVKQMHLSAAAAELRRQHAEIDRLTDENEALRAKIELIDYVLQDNLHNRLTPRVVDIAYSAFTFGRRDTPHDWFNDTKPMVMEQLAKIKKHLAEEAAHGIGEKP